MMLDMPKRSNDESIAIVIDIVRKHFPDVQAIYLYGSFGTVYERHDSDLDVGVLLPPELGRDPAGMRLLPLREALEFGLKRDVDAVDLRNTSTVLCKEVLVADRRIWVGDEYSADEFEALTLSYYQKLNDERAEIIEAAREDGRFYNP